MNGRQEGTNPDHGGGAIVFWGVCAPAWWCDRARTSTSGFAIQPAIQATAERPTNQEEARKPSGCQSPPSSRAVEMRALVFRELRRYSTSCTILVLGSHHLPSIGSHWHASARDRRRTRVFAIAAAASTASTAPEEAAMRTWAFATLLRGVSSSFSDYRTIARAKRERRISGSVISVLRLAGCPCSRAPSSRWSATSWFANVSTETMAPDSCDRVSPVSGRRFSREENRGIPAESLIHIPCAIHSRSLNRLFVFFSQ